MKTMRKTICYNCGPKMDGVNLYDFCEFEIDKVIFSFENDTCKVRTPCVKKEYITGLMLQSNIRGYYKILMIEKVDYKALWEQMCQRCDELDKKLAQRTWVGLTNDEVKKIVGSDRYTDLLKEVVQIVEAKLRSKNNGTTP